MRIRTRFGTILMVLVLTTLVAAVLVLLTNLHQGRLASRHLQSLVHHYIAGALGTLDTAIAQVRSVSHSLRPAELDDLELEPALKELLAGFSAGIGIAADLVFAWDGPPLGEIVEAQLYRVVQEALMNIEKHARASHVRVELGAVGRSVRLAVKDDGRGFDAAGASAGPRHRSAQHARAL
ncbi:ATP-binding protein [uncultured Thiodictyon sp.]|jgi:two-component system NarL family sensor kinase|uniref:sensor histidine kinase n=1 Tax=uncultured Thiodictyon sp. TaxID=1846217 RepID=UPI0025D1F96E|nr:ATP-binding protein [uncultured Thiodictyon sp.]